ncbi:MAG: IS3 family transposase [Flavobacteriaceae bacterium]|nr:IS3 family transposase [Flavobacteriaceae bacterium]MBL4888311.1 IS3 family transposase [Flavobacteriaceae bacterium]
MSKRDRTKEEKPFKRKWFYGCFGISKQAFYKRLKTQQKQQIDHQKIIEMVKDYRKKVGSKTGGIKLYTELKQDFINTDIKMGRDKFYRFLRLHQLLVPKTKNYITTTNSKHMFKKYKNLVKDQVPNRPEQLWVSDITYIKTENGHNYLALVTDAYSKRIMGYKLDNHMRTSLCTDALDMAIKNRKYPDKQLIHHSDRGFQYCNPKYTEFAEQNGIIMSMTEQYDPYENAVAERINRTLKYEYGLKQTIKNTDLAQKITDQAIYIYNNLRTHFSLDLRKPFEVHNNPNIKYKSYRKNKVNLPELKI